VEIFIFQYKPGLETHDTVIRFAPLLIIKKEELDWAFERIEKVIDFAG